jgi:hypothetical protein
MDERCIECPWFDREREACCRKSPTFCEVDQSALGVGSAIGVSGVVDVELAFGLADDGGRFGDLGQVGDLEQAEALAASHPTVGRGAVQPPAVAAARALGNDVHPITSICTVT